MISGPVALFAGCGLLLLHTLPGVGSSPYRYGIDASLTVLMLAFGDQMLLTGVLVFVQAAHQLSRLGNLFKPHRLRAGRFAQVATHPEKMRAKGANLSPLLMAILLIVAGTLSPSDGVDSGRYLPAVQLLSGALLILVTGAGCFFVYMACHREKTGNAEISQSRPEAAA